MELNVEAMYRRYGDMVLGRCRTLLRNEADAQDVCQEVFLRLHRYREGFRYDASPTTYLYRITTTTCLNHIRGRSRRREELEEEPTTIPVEDSRLASHEIRDLVRHLLAEADEGTRDCVVYHFIDGMTHDEIGELLGLSGAAVRKRISTFRARLAAHPPPWLKEWED